MHRRKTMKILSVHQAACTVFFSSWYSLSVRLYPKKLKKKGKNAVVISKDIVDFTGAGVPPCYMATDLVKIS